MRFKDQKYRTEFFEEIYNRYKNQIYRSIFNFTHHANFVEDIVQETFLIVANKLEQLNDINKCKSWIHIIAYNEAKRQLAKNNYYSLELKSEFDDNDYKNYYSSTPILSVEDEIVLIENAELTTKALEKLSYIERQLVIMKYQQELTYKEIGQILNEDHKILKWRMPAILKKLRKSIDELRGEII